MILTRLRELADRLENLPTAGFRRAPVRWLIDLDEDGSYQGISSTTSESAKRDRGRSFLIPDLPGKTSQRSAPVLLVGDVEYVLGRARKDPLRAKQRHTDFVSLVRECAEKTSDRSVKAVTRFLESGEAEHIQVPEDHKEGDLLTFRVSAGFPFDLPNVKQFWEDRIVKRLEQRAGDEIMPCIACGKLKPPATCHDIKIKGIPGGQASGLALISANDQAFESYGLEASLVAPVCQSCAEQYTRALNYLLKKEDTNLRIGGVVYVFWTRQPTEFSPATLLRDPDPDEVKRLITSVRRGGMQDGLRQKDFNILSLTANGGRAVVRSWLETTIPQVRENLVRYFEAQRIVGKHGQEPHPIQLYALCASLVRDARKDLLAAIPVSILHNALEGKPLHASLLHLALKRVCADQEITQPRAAVIKLVLNTRYEEEFPMVQERLDSQNTHPAYLCGRLFSVLEQIQRVAIPGIKATIVGRYFGTACSAPASVFGNLMRLAQSHLEKFRNEKPGLYVYFQKQMEEVCRGISAFPLVLSLPEQGLFSLGYYHQRALRTGHKEEEEILEHQDNYERK